MHTISYEIETTYVPLHLQHGAEILKRGTDIKLQNLKKNILILKLCNTVAKCVQNSENKKSFWNFGYYRKTISKEKYPRDYDCSLCETYQKLIKDFRKKGINVIGNFPLYSKDEKLNNMSNIIICFNAKNKTISIKKDIYEKLKINLYFSI